MACMPKKGNNKKSSSKKSGKKCGSKKKKPCQITYIKNDHALKTYEAQSTYNNSDSTQGTRLKCIVI